MTSVLPEGPIETVIVGGGVIGLACAEALSRAGRKVCVIERGQLGRAASWAGGGMLSVLPPDQQVNEPLRGLLEQSLALYPQWCERLRRESGIDPEYWICGGRFLKHDGTRIAYPQLAQVRNPRLMRALAEVLRRRGVPLLEDTEVQGWIEDRGVLRGLRTTRGELLCATAVLAAGAWSAPLGADGVTPAKGQMLLLRAAPNELPQILIGEDAYLIPRRDGLILLGSTLEDAGFDIRPTQEARALLLARGARLWPRVTALRIERHWAGLRPRPVQAYPLLGPHPQLSGLYLATGHFRIGLTLAPGTAERIRAMLVS